MVDRKVETRKRTRGDLRRTSTLDHTLVRVLSFPDKMYEETGGARILGLFILCPKDVCFPPVAQLIQEVSREIKNNASLFKEEGSDYLSLVAFSSSWLDWLASGSKDNDYAWEEILTQGFVLSARNSRMVKRFFLYLDLLGNQWLQKDDWSYDTLLLCNTFYTFPRGQVERFDACKCVSLNLGGRFNFMTC